MSIMRKKKNAKPVEDAVVLARHRAALGLAAIVPCDPRTAFRALMYGVEAIHGRHLRHQLREAITRIEQR